MRSDKRFEAKGIDPLTNKRKSYYSRVSQADADLQARKSYGIQVDRSVNSFYLGGFIPAIMSRSKNWRIQVAWAMKQIWSPAIGSKDIDSLTRTDIQATINDANKRYAPKSVSSAYKVIHALLELAEADGLTERNPCIKIRLPEQGPSTTIALDFTQLAHLLKHCQPLIKPGVLLAGGASLRLSEAVGAMLGDIDKDGALNVQRQVLQLNGEIEVTTTLKTPQSYRSIPLPEELRTMMLESRASTNGLWIFADTVGGYIKPKNVRRELSIACERAGMGHYEDHETKKDKQGKPVQVFIPLVTFHELRHTFISLMENELEIPRRIVEMLAGKAAKGKMGTYSHADMAQMTRAMNRYGERLSTELTTELTTELRVSGL